MAFGANPTASSLEKSALRSVIFYDKHALTLYSFDGAVP